MSATNEDNPSGKNDPPYKDDTPDHKSPDNDPQSDSPGKSATGQGETPAGADAPLTSEEWERLRAPFSRHAYVVESRATGRVEANLPVDARPAGGEVSDSNKSVVNLRLRKRAIRDRLDRVLGPGRYSYCFEPGPETGGTFLLFCDLRIGSATRTGVGSGSALRKAVRVALAEAAIGFGIGASGPVAGPILSDRESQHKLPRSILDALEQREEPSRWAPGEVSS